MKIQEDNNQTKLVRFDSLDFGDVFRYGNYIGMRASPITEQCTENRVTAVGLVDGQRWTLRSHDMVENLTDRATLVVKGDKDGN